ncbi:MAG: TRAP transporter large permease [Desulfovibrio sp.]|uniref:TRAP transporter large permease n=1 Tax=Desulfovibrio sp. 7SRBS1 TaxID=3378064 RepID=UPI003B3D5842
MSLAMVGLTGILILLLVLFLVRMPVGLAMGVVGLCGLWYVKGLPVALGLLGDEVWGVFSSYGLTVIPLFILMGQVCFYAGVNKRLYGAAYVWMGPIRGGIAMATVLACAGFSAISGSNSATAATMSTVALPEMKKYRYSSILSTGSVAAGATLGVVIPPSVVLIIIGLQTGVSIGKLFMGGVIPGILLTGLFMATIWYLCKVHPTWGPAGPRTTWREKIASLSGSLEMLLLFALVMGGLFAGFFTPSEAGAAGAGLSILLSTMRRRLSMSDLHKALMDTLRVSSMIMVIVLGAVIFGRFLAVTRLPFEVAQWTAGLSLPGWAIILMICAIYAVGGAIMDALALLLITIPIFFPVAQGLGYDPLWFGVLITVVTTLGAITPPVGVSTFIVASMATGVPLSDVFRGVSYFTFAFIACVLLMMIFPGLVLWLPGLM